MQLQFWYEKPRTNLMMWEWELWNLMIWSWPYERTAHGYTGVDIKELLTTLYTLNLMKQGRGEFRKRMTKRGTYALNRWRRHRDIREQDGNPVPHRPWVRHRLPDGELVQQPLM